MRGKSDKTVHTTIPFLNDRTVLYVDCSEGVSLLYMRDFWLDLRQRFVVAGFTFIYLPELADRLTPDLLGYLFPGNESTVPVEEMYERIQK